MKRTNLTIGLLLLFVAAAVAVYRTDVGGESEDRHGERREADAGRGAHPHRSRLIPPSSKSSRGPSQAHTAVIESLAVEPTMDHPAIAAQAERIQRGARNRLLELNEGLFLSDLQQREIFPLLARSHPDYNQSVRLIGVSSPRFEALSKRAAEQQITKLLDPDQQLDLEIMSLEAEAWWTDVIAALENDLRESTPPLSSGRAPDHDPSPPDNDPPAPPAAAPTPPTRSERGNLFDVLQQ